MKTFFERLSDYAEYGMECEQTIRLINSQKIQWENISTISQMANHKIFVLERAERMVKSHLQRYRNQINELINF